MKNVKFGIHLDALSTAQLTANRFYFKRTLQLYPRESICTESF